MIIDCAVASIDTLSELESSIPTSKEARLPVIVLKSILSAIQLGFSLIQLEFDMQLIKANRPFPPAPTLVAQAPSAP
jgi:hypothetical protein